MGLFSRGKKPAAKEPVAQARTETIAHLTDFTRTRRGVEAYLEPSTNVTQTTVVFVATSGEWTRRKVPSPQEARKLATQLGIPIYDVNLTGYPQRMRDWTSARRRAAREGGSR